MFSNILVVCVGNICRSPTGERVLQQLLPNKTISSAGIAVEKSRLTGKPADETATLIASEKGFLLRITKRNNLLRSFVRNKILSW